ncbi:MAG: hypothetical protein JNJ94_05145 [Chlorobi bacterium]|nr:hypothetical protein [Chlorobiota bacterium]
METNNQHKVVYLNGRDYCIYTKETSRWNCPSWLPPIITSSFVFLRRSLPVDTTGTILWEPPSTLEFDGSQLQPGTYLVELMLGQQRVVEKMVVVR